MTTTTHTVPYDAQRPDFSAREVFAESLPPIGEVFAEENRTLPDEATTRRARISAIADIRNAEKGRIFDHYETMFNLYKRQISAGQEENIHNQNQRRRLERSASTVALMSDQFEDSSSVLAELFDIELNADSTSEESSGVLQDLLGTTDPDEIALWEDAQNAFEFRTEIDRRMNKIHEAVENFQLDKEDRFDLAPIVDYALMVVPFIDSTSRTGNFDSDDVVTRWYDGILAGQRQSSEVGAFWMMSPEEFDAALPVVVENISKSVTDLGWRNRTTEAELLNSLADGVNVGQVNAFNFIDNGPVLGWAAMKGIRSTGSLGRVLHGAGASSEASEVYARLNRVLAEEGEVAAAQRLGEGVDDLADGTLPGAVNPATARTGDAMVNPGAEAHKRYEMGKKITEEVIGELEELKRLTPEEQAAAVDATVKRLQDEFGKDRVIDWEIRNRTSSSGIESPVAVVRLGTKAGGRFANENTLTRFLKSEGFEVSAARMIGEARTSKPALRSPSKDPTMRKMQSKIDEADVELRVNPTETEMKQMLLGSGNPVKMLQTKDGNFVAWVDEGIDEASSHIGVATQLGVPIDQVGRLHFAPGNKGRGFWKAGQARQAQEGLGADDGAFRLRNFEEPKVADPEVLAKVEDLRTREGEINREINDLKLSLQRQDLNTSVAHQQDFKKRIGRLEKELRKNTRSLRDAEADLMKEPQTANIVEEPGRGFYAEVEFPIQERGFFRPSTDQDIRFGGVGRWLLGGRQLTSKDIFGLSVQSVARRNALLRILKTEIEPSFRALNKAERGALDQIINKGEELGEWFDSLQIREMYHNTFKLDDGIMPDRFQRAYDMYRHANDMEYMLRNDELFSIKSAQGFQTAAIIKDGFEVSARNARVIRTLPDSLPPGRTYNVEDGYHYVDSATDRYNAKALQDDGYVLVETDTPHIVDTPDGTITINNFVVRKEHIEVSPLRNAQINYRAGGHRMYHPSVKWFAKQGRVTRQADTGEEFLTMPSTWKGATSRTELKEWVSRHNQGLVIAKALREGQIDEAIARAELNDIVDDVDSFLNDIDSGYIDVDIPFEAVFDRDLPTMYTTGTRPVGVEVDNTLPGYMAYSETQGRMYYSRKGAPLTDPKGNRLRTLDAYQTANRALSNIAQTIGFSTYKQRSIQKWLASYGQYLDVRGARNDSRTFLESTFKKGTPSEIERAALQERDVIRRVLNWTTPNEMRQQTMMRNLMVSLEEGNTVFGKTGGRQVAKAVNWLDEVDMISKMRGFVFDAKLGMFSVAQFPLQISTIIAAVSIDPKVGMQAVNALPFVRTYTAGKYADPSSLREVVGNRTFGFGSPEEFVDMTRELREGGFLDVNRAQVMVNDLNASNAFNLTGSGISDLRETGRFFFYEAERWNRIVAWQMAWKRARAKLGTDVDRSTFLEEVYAQADDFSMNMTEAGAAAWQKGPLSIPTQFWAYSHRLLEAAMGRQFNRTERMRLIAGQFIAYGSVGIPGIAMLSEMYQGKRGEAFDLAGDGKALGLGGVEPAAMLDRGLFDVMIRWASGNDVSYAERVGIGHFHTDLVRELFNMGRYGDTSSYELLTGATGSVMLDIGEDGVEFFKYLATETGNGQPAGPLTRQALNNLARNISSYNNSYKAYMLWKYSTLESTTNNIIFTDGTKGDALATFLGLPLGENKELSANMLWMKDRAKVVDDLARTIANYRTRLANEVGDREMIRTELDVLRELTPPDVWIDAREKAMQYTPESTLDSIGRSVTKKKQQEEMANDG